LIQNYDDPKDQWVAIHFYFFIIDDFYLYGSHGSFSIYLLILDRLRKTNKIVLWFTNWEIDHKEVKLNVGRYMPISRNTNQGFFVAFSISSPILFFFARVLRTWTISGI